MKKTGISILLFALISNMHAHHPTAGKKDEKPAESVQQKSQNFIISFTKQASGSKLSIYDSNGNQVVKNISLSEELREINLSNHPKGIYFIEIITGGKKCTSKILIQ